jgi:phosphate transport system substrate-binding protein
MSPVTTLSRSVLALALGAALALPATSPAADTIRVSGTGTALGTLAQLAEAFTKVHPGVGVKLLPSIGSGGAFRAVAEGAIEVGISARPLKSDEFSMGLVTLPYARTPFVFAGGPRVSVKDLTAEEAVQIFRGERTRWPDGERIRLVLRPRSDADSQILLGISPALARAAESAFARPGMLIAATNQEANQILARTPGALGVTSLTQVLSESLEVTPLSWNGVAPTVENLRSGAYPLEKRLYLVIKAPASPAVRRFAAFLSTPEAKRILERTGNVALALPPLD